MPHRGLDAHPRNVVLYEAGQTWHRTPMKVSLFASCAPGLEPWLEAELAALVGAGPRQVEGGVELEGDDATLATVLHGSALASHVLVRVATTHVRSLDELEAYVGRLGWTGFLHRDVPRSARVVSRGSRLHHTGAIEERVLRALDGRLGPIVRASEQSPVEVAVRITADLCTLSIDAAGEPLHRRGYRLSPHRAPLREDLAHALVVASGYDRSQIFVDPMCGSGTLAIEAASRALGLAPGRLRRFASERTPLDRGALESERAKPRPQHPAPRIYASDRDPSAVRAAIENAERAGVREVIDFTVCAMAEGLERVPEGPLLVVTNPPWGERLSRGPDLRTLYQALGHRVRQRRAGLTLATHDRKLAYATGVPLESAFLTDASGIKLAAMVSKRTRS